MGKRTTNSLGSVLPILGLALLAGWKWGIASGVVSW